MTASLTLPLAPPVGPTAPNAFKPAPSAPSAGASTAKLHKTAQAFETSFLSSMLNSMFEGVQTAAPFGGGEAETTFRSFLTDAMAKSIVRRGGVGLSPMIERELIKLQQGAR